MSERVCAEPGCGRPLKSDEKKYCPYHAGKRADKWKKITAGMGALLGAAVVVAKVITTKRS